MRNCGVELRPIAQIAAATTLDFLVSRDDRGVDRHGVALDRFSLRGHAEAFEALTLRADTVVRHDFDHFEISIITPVGCPQKSKTRRVCAINHLLRGRRRIPGQFNYDEVRTEFAIRRIGL